MCRSAVCTGTFRTRFECVCTGQGRAKQERTIHLPIQAAGAIVCRAPFERGGGRPFSSTRLFPMLPSTVIESRRHIDDTHV